MKKVKQVKKRNIPLIFARGVMVKYFHASWPIWIDLRVTYRCNLRCRYCDMPSVKISEMPTDQIKKVIDKINAHGRVILLTGGEPLVRKDIGEIVDYCAFHSDCEVRFNTNLMLLKKRYNEIKNCDGFFFSLDGSKALHEKNKGAGSWKGVKEGLEILHREKRGKISMTVITGDTTLDDIKAVLDICTKYEVIPAFQMVRHYDLSKHSRTLSPDIKTAVQIFEYLHEQRQNGYIMMNSRKGLLGQIQCARGSLKAQCYSGKLLCTVDADGIVGLCFSRPRHPQSLSLAKENVTFAQALTALHAIKPHTKRCPTCTCMAPIEFSLCHPLNIDVLRDNYDSEKAFRKREEVYTHLSLHHHV